MSYLRQQVERRFGAAKREYTISRDVLLDFWRLIDNLNLNKVLLDKREREMLHFGQSLTFSERGMKW